MPPWRMGDNNFNSEKAPKYIIAATFPLLGTGNKANGPKNLLFRNFIQIFLAASINATFNIRSLNWLMFNMLVQARRIRKIDYPTPFRNEAW